MEYDESDRLRTKLAKIYGIDDLHRFLCPSEWELYSPLLLKNVELASNTITKSIDNKEKIVIHVDVDGDGVTSGAIMYLYLKKFTDNVHYIHSQRSEGHGVDITEHLVPDDTDLLIIIDSSSNSAECCERLSKRGMKVVVIDHHDCDLLNPHCILVNPKQDGCNYPNRHLSAAPLVMKVLAVVDKHYKTNYANSYIDIAAIGLVGDMMSLKEYENRYIVNVGLRNIRNIGILALLKELKMNPDHLKSSDISFFIAPNINAAARMDRLEVVIELLIEQDQVLAQEIAKRVVSMNEERKKIQARFSEKLKPLVDGNRCSIIIDNEVGKGFKGLIAGEFCNEFRKPIMVLSEEEDGTYAGSYRAYNDFDLKSILNDIPEVIFVAGHPPAGGVRFKKEDKEKVISYLNEHLPNDDSEQVIEYVMEFNCEDLDEFTTRTIQDFYSISGKDFETGNFLIKNVCPLDKKVMGKDKNTVKIPVYPATQSWFYDKGDYAKLPSKVSLMKFRTNESYFSEDLIGQEVEVIGSLSWNEFFNPRTKVTTKTAQVFLDDYRVASSNIV